jgi:hypothetical protein
MLPARPSPVSTTARWDGWRDRRTYCQFGPDGRGLAAAFSVVAPVAGESTLEGSQSWMLEGEAWVEVKLGDGHSFHEEGEEHGVDT